jgi:DHA2 family multidrug resistance protein
MSDSAEAISPVDKWIIAASVLFGTFIVVMDVTVVNVAMPHMMGAFAEDLSSITWVATSYSIAEIIMATMAGWWSTLIGRKRLYLASMAVFTVGSILAGTAHTFTQMLTYRVIQGIGGGSLIPVSQAILREAFPKRQQGMAMAIYGMGVVVAPAAGPVIGGWLIDHWGWPWIFYINVPISAVGMLMVAAFVYDPSYLRRRLRRVDWFGIVLLATGLTGMQVVLERGQRENWFQSNWIIAGTAVTVIALVLLVIQELQANEPVINVRLLANRPLAVGTGLGMVFGVALYGTTFILPQFTQELLGYPAYESGLVLAPRALTVLLMMPIVGWLYNYVDARLLVIGGVLVMIYSYYELAQLNLQVGFWNIIPAMLVLGGGMPFMFVTLTTVSLSTVPLPDMTVATSIYTLSRRVGGNIGYAVIATLTANYAQEHRAYLVKNVAETNPIYLQFHQAATSHFYTAGLDPHTAARMADRAVDAIVNNQATMLAYNDISVVFGVMLVALIPFVFLLPGRGREAVQPALADR